MQEVPTKDQAEQTPEAQPHEHPEPVVEQAAEAEPVAEVAEEEPLTEDDDVLIAEAVVEPPAPSEDDSTAVKAIIEAAIYITDEPLSAEQIAAAMEQPIDRVKEILAQLVAEYAAPGRGLSIREIAGGYKMSTKPEHHESIRRFVKGLQAPLKLSLAALETLAVVAYRQPITGPEIMDVRGVQGAGVLKTLLDRKLIAAAGRKNVLGKPMMYKTTRDFLVQFGLNSLAELPTLKEFEELGRMALSDSEVEQQSQLPLADPAAAVEANVAHEAEAAAEAPVEAEAVATPEPETEPEPHAPDA